MNYVHLQGMAKLRTLKQKIGYNEINDEAEKRKAEKHSEQTMEVDQDTERRLTEIFPDRTMARKQRNYQYF